MAACPIAYIKSSRFILSIVFYYQESFNFKRAIVHAPGRSSQLQAIQSHENYNVADFHGCEHLACKCKAVSTTRAWYVNH